MANQRGKLLEAARVLVTHPGELADRVRGKRERDREGEFSGGVSPNRSDALAAAHELLDVEGCTSCADAAVGVEAAIFDRLGERHHQDGRGAQGRMLWSLVRHMQPDIVVETGVARGVSSAFILDALVANRRGQLWSIDLPPLEPGWAARSGEAVSAAQQGRWTYVRGASRRMLPKVLTQVGSVDIFVHDGLHTYENMTFEFETVWPRVQPGGVVVSDDVEHNTAFVDFAAKVGRSPLLISEAGRDDVAGLIRR